MADIFSKKKRSEIMSKIRGRDTKLEIDFRKKLWEAGFRYRKNVSGRFGKPDILLKKYKTVIFIDSCFWHGCMAHGTRPKTKRAFWKKKIKRNIERDTEVNRYYKKAGWKVIRIWEHDIKKNFKKIFEKTINKLGE